MRDGKLVKTEYVFERAQNQDNVMELDLNEINKK